MLRAVLALGVVCCVAGGTEAATRRIDVGGLRLSLRCEGDGSPVVILDAGAGDASGTWDWVVPDVRKITRVCTYDRAGLGRSDAGPLPRTSERIVAELHELLTRGRVAAPYILVGHSFGGLNVRLYAARHPDQVAGLVLVDATPEDFPKVEQSLHTPDELEKQRTSRALAPPAFVAEVDAMAESAAQVRASPVAASLPVVVLSSAHADDSEAFRSAWIALQKRLAGSFPNGRQIVAEKSGHYIQYDQPELIVEAIRSLVSSSRSRPRAVPPPSPDRP